MNSGKPDDHGNKGHHVNICNFGNKGDKVFQNINANVSNHGNHDTKVTIAVM
jgi:hypothetical protein